MNQPVNMIKTIENCPEGNFVANSFLSPGYFMGKLNKQILSIIKDEIDEIQKDFSKGVPWNHQLAGQIKNEYLLTKSFPNVHEYFVAIASNYYKHYHGGRDDESMRLLDLWVNFQKKNEYNPPHTHQGAVSFVIWVKVPFDIEDEMEATKSRQTTSPCAAHFCFVYSTADGTIATENIPVDKKYEGVICIFPSTVNHMVYPFKTSDGFRISVSGNVGFSVNHPDKN